LRRNHEQGIVIMLVAVVMLFVVGAMAALSIDVVTLYTARSEAQLAADGAALAGARVLANSGMTSKPTDTALASNAKTLASTVAIEVAQDNEVGGRNLVASNGEVTVSFPNAGSGNFGFNPQVTVQVQRTDLPTFFARIWGSKQIKVAASATAEAYNPSGANAAALGGATPVAPICVKPWLLPNIDPSNTATLGSPIFDTNSGTITTTTLLGWTSNSDTTRLQPACIDCGPPPAPTPTTFQYYPGDTGATGTFAPPTKALPTCTPALTTGYEKSVAGCIQTPIACNGTATIDISDYDNRNTETSRAVNCLTHAAADDGDMVDFTAAPSPPFQFIAGADDPVAAVNPALAGKDVMVSDSLVTVPVFDSGTWPPPTPVQIVGFVQLFLNPDGFHTPNNGPNRGHMNATVINMVGCGTGGIGAAVQPILGNGASPVAVRLISP
jgi:Putative Flp pilus-assembly TadE/G-like